MRPVHNSEKPHRGVSSLFLEKGGSRIYATLPRHLVFWDYGGWQFVSANERAEREERFICPAVDSAWDRCNIDRMVQCFKVPESEEEVDIFR
jgi:hypothetical protein